MKRSKDSSSRLPETIHGSEYALLYISDSHIFLTSGPAESLLSDTATGSSLSPISLPFQPTPARGLSLQHQSDPEINLLLS